MSTRHFARWGMVLGLLMAVVLYAPAQWLANAVNASSQGRVQLRDAQGSIWQGNAQWVLTSGPGGQDALALPQGVQWTVRPHWNAGVTLELRAPCCTPKPVTLQLQAVWWGVQISLQSPHSEWPAQWLSGLGAPWNTLALNGVLRLQSELLQWTWQAPDAGQGQWHGSAVLHVQQLSSGLSTLRPLGSYSLTLQGGDQPSLVLATTEGQLLMQGRGSWGAQGFVFEGEARAGNGHETALANLLGVLGQRVGNRTVLRWG